MLSYMLEHVKFSHKDCCVCALLLLNLHKYTMTFIEPDSLIFYVALPHSQILNTPFTGLCGILFTYFAFWAKITKVMLFF
jgi:hypothetical protein